MSPWDQPVAIALIGFGVGSFVGILALAAVAELITRLRR